MNNPEAIELQQYGDFTHSLWTLLKKYIGRVAYVRPGYVTEKETPLTEKVQL